MAQLPAFFVFMGHRRKKLTAESRKMPQPEAAEKNMT